MVRMWPGKWSLMSSIIDAIVVVFPDPVGPVTRTKPEVRLQTSRMTCGSPRLSKAGILVGITRRAPATEPRCW